MNPFVGSRTRHTLPIHSMRPPARCARARIDDWTVVDGGSCPFEAPELRPIKIVGVVSNHSNIEDGPITTSLVQMIDQARGLARTLSTEYELGAPSVAFAAQLAKLGGAPLRYNNERVTRAAEQLAYKASRRSRRMSVAQANELVSEEVEADQLASKAERSRRLSAVHTKEPTSEQAASAPSLNSRLYTASVSPVHRLCATSMPPTRRLCAASAPPLRRFCTTSAPPLQRPCAARDAPRHGQICNAHPWSGGRYTLRVDNPTPRGLVHAT